MNKEAIKMMNKKPKQKKEPNAFQKWWKKNRYIIFRIILFPIWICVWSAEKIEHWRYINNQWDSARAKTLLDYYIPHRAKWDVETKTFRLCHNDYGWTIKSAKKYLRLSDRKFWAVNTGWVGGELRKYLVESYELDGFTKKVIEDDWNGFIDIEFILKETD
jgi:hypothetical protein